MRILAISGQNIASLSQAFTIDFTSQPLAGAGLFAITGETGAGKSSILDAMCLALYGDAPRLSGGAAADEVPDPSGEALKARDARAILRRGAAQGWAEVRFTARDGQDYTVRWSARRARDKAEGKLQAVNRALARVSDGQVIASQLREVNEQVEALTGFSYDEFRRTVLLAQGDFDAFLRADTNDRAGLLEKVTGTGLYRDVSMRIYERTEAARQRLQAAEQRREAHALLSPDALTSLAEERALLLAQDATDRLQGQALRAALDQHRRHSAAVSQQTLAAQAVEQALAKQADAAGLRAELARHDAALPLRAPWAALQQARRRLVQAEETLQAAEQRAQAASQTASVLAEKAKAAEEAFDAQETAFKHFGPLWSEAADLDSQIRQARQEQADAAEQAAALAEAARRAGDALAALQAQEAEQRTLLSEAEADLAQRPADRVLAADWPQVQGRLTELAEAQTARLAAEVEKAKAATQAASLSGQLDKLDLDTANARKEEAGLASEITAQASALEGLEAQHPPSHEGILAALAVTLAEMGRAGADHAKALSDAGSAQAQAAQAKAEQRAAEARADIAAKAEAEAQIRVSTLTAPAERADRAASEAAQALRLQLEPGTPCPVCGASDHPIHATDAALAEIARGLRADLDAARDGLRTAGVALAAAQRAGDAARIKGEAAERDHAKAEAASAQALADWSAARERATASALCPDLPETPAGDLTPAQEAIAAARTAEAEAQSALTRIRRAQVERNKALEAVRTRLAELGQRRDSLASARSEAASEMALAVQRAGQASDIETRLAAALTPLLDTLGLTLGMDGLVGHLANRVAAVTALGETAAAARQALSDLAPKCAAQAEQAAAAREQARQAADRAGTRASALQELEARRAPLLGGEATAAHRTRHNDARIAAQAARDQARSDLAKADADAAVARTQRNGALEAVDAARALLEQGETDLSAALQASSLQADELDSLLARPLPEIDALRQQLQTLDDTVTRSRAALEQRQQDLAALLDSGLPEETVEVLEARLGTLESGAEARQQRIGEIRARLDADAQSRQDLQGLETEIAGLKAEHDVWQAVNAAVGSRQGDRFARIAQRITLDVLVEHANRHLADLNPRYSLRTAENLALQVEDRDMAGEARATRSLSGGERFLVSLALALALSRMGGKGGLAATLFIDEGFGSLDAGSLDLAIDALESLQSQGRQVGVISHVEAMKDRIPTRIVVRKQGGGRSVVEVTGQCPVTS